MIKVDLEKRVSSDKNISLIDWNESLIDVCQFLSTELKFYMSKENRNFGIVKLYFNELDNSFKAFNKDSDEEKINIYGSVLFLIKPVILSVYEKLKSRRLSEADSIIVILNKILSSIIQKDNCIHKSEVEAISKIIENLWKNIRNSQKNSSLNFLVNTVEKYRTVGKTGKHNSDEFSFAERKKEKIDNPVEICLSSNNVINEEGSNEVTLS